MVSLSAFGIKRSVDMFFPLPFFWKSLGMVGINFSLNVWWNSSSEAICSSTLFVGRGVSFLGGDY